MLFHSFIQLVPIQNNHRFQEIIIGMVIILAVGLDKFRQKKAA